MDSRDDWTPVVDLIERIAGDADLMASVASVVRAKVREIAVLPSPDIAGHTRALLVAATRALAARRGPTEAELSFVEELAVTRARQGVPIEAVLGAIHVAERAIWSRAREVAGAAGVGPDRLLDARELYDDWAEAMRARLIAAHHATKAGQGPRTWDREASILRRLLDGGSAAALAAAEAGLPVTGGLWVVAARPGEAATGLERSLREQPPVLCAVVDGLLVGVLGRAPSSRAARAGAVAGLAGPADPEDLATVRRLAVAALNAAESTGRDGVVHVARVPALAAMADRTELAAVLLDHHRPAWTALGTRAEPVARAVCAWLEADRDVATAAERLFVHPNTVRNRLQRFADVTGIDPYATFGAVDAWWLCHAWLTRA
ncbi:helix-turn-helix domain-containing protein [Nonomuraea cavernae]|uniref:helix-turn-helix domain-containing protein n=1 Tax=Nonomuraea cavernae TaxID=2045107 RepID=UPI001CD9BD9C|nr:helix-turn-helix domain-containing protein [Nonomuraea cavernae]MCA2187953.1 helix-turn-helix domain-containing protein [Nonomuraea cavernae]